jgi:hypothetical protein
MRFTFENPHLIKLLGTYELEIHPAIEKLREFHFTKIINIGAAEGYYTVGFAMLWPEATIYAFESDQNKRNAISKLAEDNAVTERISINGTCTAIHLAASLNEPQPMLILCDVEGQEKEILNPRIAKGLDRAHVLVELHDMYIDGCSAVIMKRFEKTHFIEKYPTRDRKAQDFPLRSWTILNFITEKTVIDLMQERRPAPQIFFLMIPRNGP